MVCELIPSALRCPELLAPRLAVGGACWSRADISNISVDWLIPTLFTPQVSSKLLKSLFLDSSSSFFHVSLVFTLILTPVHTQRCLWKMGVKWLVRSCKIPLVASNVDRVCKADQNLVNQRSYVYVLMLHLLLLLYKSLLTDSDSGSPENSYYRVVLLGQPEQACRAVHQT